MKRRVSDQGDSFDLFLDTICNTFGGIVFLAILVALLVKIRHDPSGNEHANQPITPLVMRNLELQLARQQARLRDLQKIYETVPTPKTDATMTNLVEYSEEIKKLSVAESQLVSQRKHLAENLINIASKAAEIPDRIKQAEEELSETSIALAIAKAEWQVVRAKKAKTMQVPLERVGAGARGIILLSHNELFLVASPDDAEGDFFEKHVTSKPIPDTDSYSYEIKPRIGKGITLGSEKSIVAIRETARRLALKDSTLIIAVYPDSYHQFGPVRDAFKSYGMNYELWIQSAGEPLQVSYGVGRNRVQ
ncbi:hypothetical protein LOC67_19040 [Stieleria sp. JC731]|uniref:hypothetical protein n=1 Tax=Pirellulaceae TaxID=2691357 RepID=UPI001E4267B5|nr:hypothetical protein [Stieleria sp. JC731]MCC9602651.1 hypothetical protein [Stieleria sp. JC731]